MDNRLLAEIGKVDVKFSEFGRNICDFFIYFKQTLSDTEQELLIPHIKQFSPDLNNNVGVGVLKPYPLTLDGLNIAREEILYYARRNYGLGSDEIITRLDMKQDIDTKRIYRLNSLEVSFVFNKLRICRD